MANRQVLETIISIGAQVGNGFSQVGATLTELGSMVNGLSQDLIQFGQDSISVYRDYEKSMADASVALSTTYGQSTKELSSVMSQLDSYATNWAATTIFHTDDVSNAISEAAHAGWDFEQIIAGIPAAMQLAQAGSIDLSDAVNYIVKSTNAMGIEFDDVGEFIDQWAFAANSSASTIDEFGQAMLRMGSTMRFAGSTEELMTLIAVTANAGSVGSEAGTMIRNSIMRLIAPTQKADKAMGELGATSEETAELLNDEALMAANAALEAQGFSAFDQEGNLKPVLDIYRELYVALGEIAGGYENLNKNESALKILSAIFPTRTITEALNLLNAAADGYSGLYDAMESGAAEGYGAYAADVMMDTLNGHIEIFNSKVERLKQVTGERLADQVSGFLAGAGDFVDDIANLDEGKFGALVSGLEVFAGAGPALLAGGTAFRFIGRMLGPVGGIGMGLVALTSLIAAVESMNRSNFADMFGTASLELDEIDQYARSIHSSFTSMYDPVQNWKNATEEAFQTFRTSGESLFGELLTASITKKTLTETDKQNLYALAAEMQTAFQDGITNATNTHMEYVTALLGNDPEALSRSTWITEYAYNNMMAEAEGIGNDFKTALTKAFEDGKVTDDEIADLNAFYQNYVNAMADAAAAALSDEKTVEMMKAVRKAASGDWEDVQEAVAILTGSREETVGELQENLDTALAYSETQWNKAIKNGDATETQKAADISSLESAGGKQIAAANAQYGESIFTAYEQMFKTNDIANEYEELRKLANEVLAGTLTREDASRIAREQYGNADQGGLFPSTARKLGEELSYIITNLGSYEGLEELISYSYNQGDIEKAYDYMLAYTMDQIITGGQRANITGLEGLDPRKIILGDNAYSLLPGYQDQFFKSMLAQYEWDVPTEPVKFTITPVIAEGTPPVPMTVIPHYEGMDDAAELQAQGFKVDVTGDVQELQGVIDGEDGQTLMQYVDGDASDLHMRIMAEDGQTIKENITGDATQLEAVLRRYSGHTIYVNIAGRRMFAEGGRATEASIFGEAGPEWAIPEEHSARTAALLDAARVASGFTWGEILGRFGGLNANASHTPATIIYSPTINAGGSNDLDQILQNDKKRLEKWYQNKMLKDKLEVYS